MKNKHNYNTLLGEEVLPYTKEGYPSMVREDTLNRSQKRYQKKLAKTLKNKGN